MGAGDEKYTQAWNCRQPGFVKVQFTSVSTGRVVNSSVPIMLFVVAPFTGSNEHEIERELSAGIISVTL